MAQSLLDRLNVRVVGSGTKFLVFGHGFGTDQSAWNHVLPNFTATHRVILYDLPFAGSVNPEFFDFRRYSSLDAYVDDLLLILDSIGVDSCAYVGHSISAMIGILASIRRPMLFSKLILIGASPRFLNDEEYQGGFELGETEIVFSAMKANYEAWVKSSAPLVVGADVPEAVEEYSRTLSNMRPDISMFVSQSFLNSDLREVLGLVKVPCCIIQTAKDISVPESMPTFLKNNLGGQNTVEMLDIEGHLPHLSAPLLLAQCLIRVLST